MQQINAAYNIVLAHIAFMERQRAESDNDDDDDVDFDVMMVWMRMMTASQKMMMI